VGVNNLESFILKYEFSTPQGTQNRQILHFIIFQPCMTACKHTRAGSLLL